MSPTDPRLEDRLMARLQPLKPRPAERDGSPAFLGLTGSLLCPGLGHLIAGRQYLSAVCFLIMWAMAMSAIGTLVIPQYYPYLIVIAPLAVVLHFSQAISAARLCRKTQEKIPGDRLTRYAMGLIFIAVALVWQHQAAVYLRDNIAEIGDSPTTGMAPNVVPGDYFMVLRQYPFGRWNLVAVLNPNSADGPQFVKRVVGLPGEEIEITGDGVMINGALAKLPPDVDRYLPMDRSHVMLASSDPLNAATGCWGKPIRLEPDEYFLLGDNSPVSDDGRFWPSIEGHQPGAMPKDQIVGRAVTILWPPARWRSFLSPPANAASQP